MNYYVKFGVELKKVWNNIYQLTLTHSAEMNSDKQSKVYRLAT